MTKQLEDLVAVVTGASSGIGEATALALAERGARVTLAARRVERLRSVAARITAIGGEAFVVAADVALEADAAAIIEKTHARFGRVDILVNSAGIMLLGPIDGAHIEDWARMININLLGLMYTTHAALPVMKRQGRGHIVNIASAAGRIANPGVGAYAATKFGVVAFSESLRREVYKDRIRVTVIEPGVVATDLSEHITNPEAKQSFATWVASMQPLHADDVANAIVYAVTQPPYVSVSEILLRPTDQER